MSFLTEFFGVNEFEGEAAVCCPFPHTTPNGLQYLETNASAHVNTNEKLFHCKACGRGYNEAQFIMEVLGCNYEEMSKIQRCFQSDEDIGEWMQSTSLTQASKERALNLGISESVIEELNLATPDLTEDQIAFPVFMYGHLMDIRTYNPGHKPKMKSRIGATAGLIIPFDIWKETSPNRWTLLCAGEKDMAVARSNGFNAITLTGGEGAHPVQPAYFKDRKVAIVYDNDGPGISGANRLAKFLSRYTDKIKVVTRFHEICKEEHEDITDFFTKYNGTKQQLIKYIEETDFYDPKADPEYEPAYPIMNLLEASKPENINKMIRTNVQVVSVSEDTFACATSVIAEKFRAGGPNDSMMVGEIKQWELNERTLKDVLHLIDNNFTEEKIKEHLKDLMHIMQKEKYVTIKTLARTTIFKAYVTDLFETTDDSNGQPMEYVVYSIGKKLESGQKYMITHKLVPHPYKGQQLISIATDFKQADDSVSDFKITPETISNLKVIQDIPGTVPEKVETLIQKVKGILGYNGNDTLIASIDLAFNTALQFNFGAFKAVRGYLDLLLISESRIGKSSTASALRQTYGLGAIVSLAGNSATIPGLVGGSNKTATGYQTRAGVIPQNHKGLIIFEEFGKSSHQVSSELTDIRSSNEVRIARVSGTLTLPALVRMITLTNPKTSGQIKSIASYPNGFSILTELVEAAEDIARYDMIVILSDKGANNIDPLWTPEEPLPQEVYRSRIRWIWSRTPEQIVIPDDVKEYIVQQANELNELYDCHIKIFGTEAWKKIARLAISIAGYTVSTDETYENIIVTKECVDYAVTFYKSIYDNSTFKLKEYVDHERQYSSIDADGVRLLQDVYDKNPMLILQLEQTAAASKTVLQAATGMSMDDLNKALNTLTKGLFVRFSGYDIIPTERFRIGVSQINKNSFVPRVGEVTL